MSGVALPHVPSARAPSSAASSTRRSLHSAGSTASRVSAASLNHSINDDEDDVDESGHASEEDDEEDEQEEEPHESSSGSGSGGLWDEVESFLNKPSPSFAALAKDSTAHKSSTAGANVLPTLRGGDRKQPVAPPGGGGNQSGPRASRPSVRQYTTKQSVGSSTSSSGKAIDPKLLQEAFAYAEKIQRVNFDDGDDDEATGDHDQQREAERRGVGMLRRDSSFGAGSSNGGGGPRMPPDAVLQKQGSSSLRGKADDAKSSKKKKSAAGVKSSAYGVSARPLPTKKKPSSSERRASGGGWDASPSSTADPNGDGLAQSRKGAASMDQQTIQSLVSSLQNGTAVDELRRELAASQQILARSRLVIQEAAKSFFRK